MKTGVKHAASLALALQELRQRPESFIELTEDVLAAHVPAWRGYAAWAPARIREQAHALVKRAQAGATCGPWYGLPVSVKDNMGLTGGSLSAGSFTPLPASWQRDAAMIARCRRDGALFTGVTHSVPFAFTSLGVTPNGEGPRNPWRPDRVCGGSSSGAAVSIAEGSAWLALGSDTAGSIRVPAAMTGGVGLKLTSGRWPMQGVIPLSHTLDSWGVLTASVADLTDALNAREGSRLVLSSPLSLRKLRLGVLHGAPRENADAGIDARFDQALLELEAAGAQLIDINFPEARDADALFRSGGLVAAELETFLSLQLPAWRKRLEPPLDGAMARASELSVDDYRQRLATFQRLSKRAARRFYASGIDALLLPTTPLTPPRRSEVILAAAYAAADKRILRHTAFVNYLRLCALSLPIGLDTVGLPVGLQLVMPGFTEPQLLAVGTAIERCLGTPRQRLGMPPRP